MTIENRRTYIGPMVDAILTYWLQATHENDDLREWWESNDAADTALEMAHAIVQHLADVGIGFAVLAVPEGDARHGSVPDEETPAE